MIVSELIAQALLDIKVGLINYVPGYGGTAVYQSLAERTGMPGFISFNEEVAYAVAHGACLMGTRAAMLCKTHGIMKAGNSVSDSLMCGTTAGLVVIIAEDKGGTHSDSIIETKPFLDGIGMPNFWSNPKVIYDDIHKAYGLSEKYRLPWAVIFDADDVNANTPYLPRYSTPPPIFTRDITQHILSPLFNRYQHQVYQAKMADDDWGSILKPMIPTIPGATPDNWKKATEAYEPFFKIFKKYRGEVVTGDTGITNQFSADPYHCIDVVTYMGGSIPLAAGAYLSGKRNVWAISGDFSFLSAGLLGLLEARLRNIPLKVIILDNGKAVTTGGQPVAENALQICLAPYMDQVIRVNNPDDAGELEKALKEMTGIDDLRILLVDYRNQNN